MGLDTVELVITLEERFGISIPDQEAEKVQTVGDLVAMVRRMVQPRPSDRCLTSAVFYRLRRAIVVCAPPGSGRLRPASPLDEAVPPEDRRQLWLRIAATAGLELPPLSHSPAAQKVINRLSLAGGLLCGVLTFFAAGWSVAIVAGLAASMALIVLLTHIDCRGLHRIHVGAVATFGDLAKETLSRNFGALASACDSRRERELRDSVYRIIAEITATNLDDLRPEMNLVKDLNFG